MKTKFGRTLSSNGVRTLLARVPNRLDAALSNELRGSVYVLEDGGAVIVSKDGSGAHWFSCEELVSGHRAVVKAALERKDPLTELLPNPERFRTDVPTMVGELPTLLGIKSESLDYSEKSLDAVDRAIRRLGSERFMSGEVFPSLIAYVGEVIRRHVRGVWEIRSTSDGARLEPEIVEITGGRHQLLPIYKELLEHGRTASMRVFVHVALRKHRMLPPN